MRWVRCLISQKFDRCRFLTGERPLLQAYRSSANLAQIPTIATASFRQSRCPGFGLKGSDTPPSIAANPHTPVKKSNPGRNASSFRLNAKEMEPVFELRDELAAFPAKASDEALIHLL